MSRTPRDSTSHVAGLAGGLLVHDAAVFPASNTATDDAGLRRGRPAPRVDVQRGVRAVRRLSLEQ